MKKSTVYELLDVAKQTLDSFGMLICISSFCIKFIMKRNVLNDDGQQD